MRPHHGFLCRQAPACVGRSPRKQDSPKKNHFLLNGTGGLQRCLFYSTYGQNFWMFPIHLPGVRDPIKGFIHAKQVFWDSATSPEFMNKKSFDLLVARPLTRFPFLNSTYPQYFLPGKAFRWVAWLSLMPHLNQVLAKAEWKLKDAKLIIIMYWISFGHPSGPQRVDLKALLT